MPNKPFKKSIKSFFTHNPLTGEYSGMLYPLLVENGKTKAYITTIDPHSFKGYHLHKIRTNHLICVKGVVEVITYDPCVESHFNLPVSKHFIGELEELVIEPGLATGFFNRTDTPAYILSLPDPPYDPEVDEQVDYTFEELKAGVVK